MKMDSKSLLYITIALNVCIHACLPAVLDHWWDMPSAILNTSMKSVLASMFRHVSTEQLVETMLLLFFCGREVFVNTTSRMWKTPLAFLVVYVGSGFGAQVGPQVAFHLRAQMLAASKQAARELFESQCTHWICNYEFARKTLVEGSTLYRVRDQLLGFGVSAIKPQLGVAEGAVCGVVGAMAYTWICGPKRRSFVMVRLFLGFASLGLIVTDGDRARQAIQKQLLYSDMVSSVESWAQDEQTIIRVSGYLNGILFAMALNAAERTVMWRQLDHPRWGQGQRLGGY